MGAPAVQMGCERELESEALSDYMLALGALLEPEGSPRRVLAGRLAALCALPRASGSWRPLVVRALELEREVIPAARREAPRATAWCGPSATTCARSCATSSAVTSRPISLRSPTSSCSRRRRRRPAAAPEGRRSAYGVWEEPGDAGVGLAAGPRRPAPVRVPVAGRDPMPVADEIDDDQLRLIGMHG